MALMPPLDIPPLGISEGEARTRFAALQRKLVPLWEHIRRFNESEQTIVVVPSQTIEFDCEGAEMQAYEERRFGVVAISDSPDGRKSSTIGRRTIVRNEALQTIGAPAIPNAR